MFRKLLFTVILCVILVPSFASADEVVKWVDENGVTHFGNPQFAPSGQGRVVEVPPANAMDVPDTTTLGRQAAAKNMNMVVLDRPTMENPRGWRGYNKRHRRGRG